jgi:hypothetical protein
MTTSRGATGFRVFRVAERLPARSGPDRWRRSRRVPTVIDFVAAASLGVRDSFGENTTLRYDMLGAFARWAAEGRLAVPIARTFALDEWDLARAISQGGQARGKLVLLPGGLAAGG